MKKKVKTRKKITLQSVIMYILLILTALMFATPMLFTLLSSIKTKVEIFAKPFSWPEVPQWSNYVEAWTSANMSHYFLNSLIQAGATVIVLAIVYTMAAYVLS